MCKSIPCTVLFLSLDAPGILVVEKDSGTTCQIVGRLRFARSIMFPEFSYLFYKGFIFPSAGSDGYAVRSYYPIMILLCAVQRLAIAIRTDKIASTGKYTPHPQTDSSRKRLRINAPPIHLSRLQLHHAIRTLYRTEEVIRPCNTQRISYPISTASDTFVIAIHHIACITLEIECRTTADMSFIIVGDIVGSNPLVLCIFSDQQTLFIQKIIGLRSGKTTIIQNLMMIHKHLDTLRKSDFIKRRISLTPESSSPRVVQQLNVVIVFCTEIITESLFRFRIIVELYGRFIVELPSDNTGIIAIMLCQFLDHLIR